MSSNKNRGVDLQALRSTLRDSMETLGPRGTHKDLDSVCRIAGLIAPPTGNKPERAAGAVDAAADERLVDIANRLLVSGRLEIPDRNRLQDVLWAACPAPRVVKRHRRELARAIGPEDLYLKVDQFDRLLNTLFIIDPDPFGNWFEIESNSLQSQIRRHVYENQGDWSVEHLFDRLGALEASDKRFALFVEGLVSPDVRPDEANQREAVLRMNLALAPAQVELRETDSRDGYPVFSLVSKHLTGHGRPKHLIFASPQKPDLRFIDALTGDIEIVTNADRVLVYDEPISDGGLRWRDLQAWWAQQPNCGADPKASLYRRLKASMPTNSPPQQNLFVGYHRAFSQHIQDLPALIPEVWLHWDPKTVHQRGALALAQHRMDFLMLLPNGIRVVLEVDGRHHYASDDGKADVERYAAMMKADRALKLAGYHVFRFGAVDLPTADAPCIADFFSALFERFSVPVPR